VKAVGDVVHFARQYGQTEMFCAFNLSGEVSEIQLPEGDWTFVGQELHGVEEQIDGRIQLGAWQSCFALRTT